MADLNRYKVDFGDFETEMKLSDEDAESYGDRASKVGSVEVRRAIPTHHGIQLEDPGKSGEKQAEAPKNKARTAPAKSS